MRPSSEGPQETREGSSSAPSQGNSRPRARGGWFGKSADGPEDAVDIVERTKSTQPERDWRSDMERLHQPEISAIALLAAPTAATIRQVVIFGLDQLKPASAAYRALHIPCVDQGFEPVMCIAIGLVPESDAHFFDRWRETMCLHMGADEAEKFLIHWAQRLHGRTP